MMTLSSGKKRVSNKKSDVQSEKKVKKDVKKGKPNIKTNKKNLNKTWEMAVEHARGRPDGDMTDDSESEMEVDVADFNEATKPVQKTLSKASQKLQKIKGKKSGILEQKGKKRKSTDEKNDDGKKMKLEELKKKERKKQRKMTQTNYTLSKEAKKLWGELRRMDLTPENRKTISSNLYKLVEGNSKKLIYAHDTSRVIQCLMKYRAQEHKNALFKELQDEVVEMSKSKYAKFFVRKLLKYGTKEQRDHVFKSLYSNVRKLMKHKEAAEILEFAYNMYANAVQRAALMEEFYGPSFALFKTSEIRTLDQLMTSQPEKKDSILSNMKECISTIVEKSLFEFSIGHRLCMEYFTYCSPQQRSEMIEVLRESVIHVVHTRDGARIAMICLWYGSAKDRKVIIKSMKSFVLKLCKEEFGHMVLLAMFDVVDDTKIVQKIILEEMQKSLHEIVQDQYGRKVLLYLLAPRDPKHFHPDVVKVLLQGDSNPHSKKEVSLRRKELLEAISKPLLQYIVKYSDVLVVSSACLLLMLAILTHAIGDPTEAMVAIAKLAAKPFTASSGDASHLHIIEDPAGHMTFKRLVLNDADRLKQGETVLFSNILLDVLPKGAMKSWAACNRGCFLIVFIIELGQSDIQKRLSSELSEVKDSLKKLKFKGAQLLLKKLNELKT